MPGGCQDPQGVPRAARSSGATPCPAHRAHTVAASPWLDPAQGELQPLYSGSAA